jgi:crotonobetainyl-CoA:carnitine CoA-transferase CaiB-like acyl-CoA transferase
MERVSVLQGVKVLDFGRYIAGPFCAALLADFGADVIRVDRIGGSEDRFILPVTADGEGAQFLQVNRNKRSITLDIDSEQGRAVVRRMVQGADVVIANMPPRVLANLGLDYATLSALKPDIILTASTAFGTHPAMRDRVGFDGVGQAISGLVHMGGWPDQPVKAMVPVVDFATAMACAFGTAMALVERRASGKGQEVGVSLQQTALNLCSASLIEEAMLKVDRKATLNRAPHYAPSDIFRCTDGWIIAQVLGQGMFKRWTRLVGRPELFDDERFADDAKRGEHGPLLCGLMSEWCAQRLTAQALEELEAARIPGGPVRSPRQVLDDPLLQEAQAFAWMPYPGADGAVPIVATPVTLSRTPPTIDRRPPCAGEHTDEVLQEYGFSAQEIAELRAGGTV